MTKIAPKSAKYIAGIPQKIPTNPQNIGTGGQTRTLDSSQRDVPVCETFPQGVLVVPVLVPATPGRKRRSARGTVACQGTKFDRQKGPKGPFCGQIWSAFGKKSPMSRVGEGGVSEKKKKKRKKETRVRA